MSLRNKIIKAIAVCGLSAGAVVGMFTAANYSIHDYRRQDLDGTLWISKSDGPIGHTKFTRFNSGTINITRSGPSGYFSYDDNNGDSVVDKIYIRGPCTYDGYQIKGEIVHRSKHYEKVPSLFREADKEFNEQLERFGFGLAEKQ